MVSRSGGRAGRRLLAQRLAALQQYRQECLRRAADPAAAERRLERLRRRLAALCAAEEQTLARERHTLQAEAASLEQRQHQLEQYAASIASQGARLSKRELARHHKRALAQTERARRNQQIHCLQEQPSVFERQLQDLQDEVERLARLLLNEPESAAGTTVQAA